MVLVGNDVRRLVAVPERAGRWSERYRIGCYREISRGSWERSVCSQFEDKPAFPVGDRPVQFLQQVGDERLAKDQYPDEHANRAGHHALRDNNGCNYKSAGAIDQAKLTQRRQNELEKDRFTPIRVVDTTLWVNCTW